MIKKFIRKIISKEKLNKVKLNLSLMYKFKFSQYKNCKKIIFILTPTHGNIGDQAIAYATNKYLEEQFSEYKILEFYRDDIYKYGKSIKSILNDDDVIVLHGGGNMGNLYIEEEVARRLAMEIFPNNKIISMTQTINFSEDDIGKKELLKSQMAYNKHKNLTLIAREQKSYHLMNQLLDVENILLNPDIVLYLSDMFTFDKSKRKNIMTCLRSDKESVLGKQKNDFINRLNSEYKNVFNYDTVIPRKVLKEKRHEELKDMFNKFLSSKVVITDRLHGMVFCVITKTPCIVTKSLDHKVIGTYEWVKDLNYIKLVDDLEFENIQLLIDELSNIEQVNEINFKEIYFDKLTDKLKGVING